MLGEYASLAPALRADSPSLSATSLTVLNGRVMIHRLVLDATVSPTNC